ncbi:hypothetical protein SE17_22810, partial [Kouleothrix aurantiaca]
MLQGKNVTLRAIERDDLKTLHELTTHIESSILADGAWEPDSLAAMEKRFEKRLERDNKSWFGIHVDGRLVGDINLHSIDMRSRVSAFGVAIYAEEAQGQGYGREAIGLFLDWAFFIMNFERIWLTSWSTNQRAIRCYRALGFVDEGRQRRQLFVNGEYVDVILMGLLRDEWRAHNKG